MKRILTPLSLAACVSVMLSFSSPSAAPAAVSAYNPQCTAIAKSTGKQCKNKQWGKCEVVLCYVHCK